MRQDLTGRRCDEVALRECEARFRALVLAGSSSVYRASPDWRAMRRVDGAGIVADKEAPTADWIDTCIPPEEQPRVHAAIARAIGAKDIW